MYFIQLIQWKIKKNENGFFTKHYVEQVNERRYGTE